MAPGRVLVAMSGGVDSSLAAAMLQEQGYDVSGITHKLQPGDSSNAERAAQLAGHLKIPHHVLDLNNDFANSVITPFRQDYLAGRTPNPCVRCNYYIKFGALLEYALKNGFSFLATGHYARLEESPQGWRLFKGADKIKDQSYFLYMLNQRQLQHALFPLGKLTKSRVKEMAISRGLAGLVRPDESQDICFIPDGDYATFVYGNQKPQPGDIVDASGRVLGKHRGLAYYTTGQRKGLEISSSEPLYVISLDAVRNRVVVGPREALYRAELTAAGVNWICGQPEDTAGITARVRYRSPEVATSLSLRHNTVHASFATPQWGIAPGQSVVFYRGDEALGGGIIQQ